MSTCAIDDAFGGLPRLYGEAGFEILKNAHVCVVGVGGVGSWSAEGLARNAVGRITLIDHDDICRTNINRQIHALQDTVGQSKVGAMADRVTRINPECDCRAVDDFVTEATLDRLLTREFDYVIDAIDSVRFKAAMIHYCKRNRIPVIATGGAGGLTDPTAIGIADLSKTHNDPLAAKVRATLRRRYGFTRNPGRRFGVECVFSRQQQVYPRPDGTVGHEKPGVRGTTLDCNTGYGSTSLVTAVFGLVAAARVVNRLIGNCGKS